MKRFFKKLFIFTFFIGIAVIIGISVRNNILKTSELKHEIREFEAEETEEEAVVNTVKASSKMVGIYTDSLKDIEKFNGSISIIGWFDNFNSGTSNKLKMCLDEKKYTAFITLQPKGMPLSDIAAGVYDEKITEYLKNLSSGDRVNSKLFIRFAHEMEYKPAFGLWYEWQSDDYETYIAAWRRVVTLGREYAPNVQWVWSPNRADSYSEPFYPGDEYVDYVSLSLNNADESIKTLEDFYVNIGTKVALESRGKPVIIGECAEASTSREQKVAYLNSMFDFLETQDAVCGFVYFNYDVNETRQFNISNDEEYLSTFVNRAKQIKEKYEKND